MNRSNSEPLRAFVPSCEAIRDLMLLDALGEITPEQKATLAIHFQSDPALAAEHAGLTLLSSTLAMDTTAIPPMPEHVLMKLSAQFSPPSQSTAWRHLAKPLAIAACLTVLAAMGGWCLQLSQDDPQAYAQLPLPPIDNSASTNSAPRGAAESSSYTPVRRALLIGVELKDSDTPKAAKTRAFDVKRFSSLLQDSFNFPPENIHRLLNEDATTANVTKAIEDYLITPVREGDVVVILYTGHGTQVSDLDGDEEDGLDEALCTYDYDWQNPSTWFTDDRFSGLLSRIRTSRILVVNTACHSGSSTRGTAEDADIHAEGFSSGFQPKPGVIDGFDALDMKKNSASSYHILLSGCASNEVSWRSDETGCQLLTELIPRLKTVGKKQTFDTLVADIRPILAAKGKANCRARGEPEKPQTPQLEGSTKEIVMEYLTPRKPIATPVTPAPPSPPPPPLPTWQSQSGDIALHLTTDKTIYTEGDLMQVTVTPDLDCHLRLYYLSADHKVHQIFPNQFQTESLVKKGQPVTLPGAAGSFEFRMSAPFGNEILMAVASDVPFTDQSGEDLKTQLFQEFKDTNLETLAHRGITVGEKKALTGRALHLYRVEAKK